MKAIVTGLESNALAVIKREIVPHLLNRSKDAHEQVDQDSVSAQVATFTYLAQVFPKLVASVDRYLRG